MKKAHEKKNTGFITKIEMKKPSAKILYYTMFAIMVIVSLSCFLPLMWIVISGFKDTKEFYMVPPTIIPKSFHPEKLLKVWGTLSFSRYYINSFIQATGCVVVCLLFNGLAGYAISRLKPVGHKVLSKFLFIMLLMPTTIGQVPLFMQLVDLPYIHKSALNSYIPLWLMTGGSAYNIILFKSFFDSISQSYIEAAKLDGCSVVGIFFRIMVPLCVPVFMVLTIFTFNGSWGGFLWPALLIDEQTKYTVAEFLFRLDKTNFSLDEYMLILTFSMVPPLLIFIIFQKYIMTGFKLGGVKE